MTRREPRVSIGLPVYNGENFIHEALESLLAQTFDGLEVIISDNASTDNTEQICRAFAERDNRVRYQRNEKNIGASGNYERVFQLASGEYFKWAAHDDICLPNFLARCVEVLDRDPSVVLCYTRTITIDEEGRCLRKWPPRPELGSKISYRRFREMLGPVEHFAIWGVIRANILRKTRLLGNYPEHDRALLSRLSLYGRFYEVPDFLFLDRDHTQRAMRRYDFRKPHEAITWYDPDRAGKLIFPAWRVCAEHVAGINQAPISLRERVACYVEVTRWLTRHRQELLSDLVLAVRRLAGVGPLVMRAYGYYVKSTWLNRTKRAVRDLEAIVPVEEMLILVDEAKLDTECFARWRTIPFLEREGNYWGPPGDDGTAVSELERLRGSGANFIAFAWPTFWWLDYYPEFHAHLRSEFRCVLQNHRLVVYDLRW
jgi:glycosyltransferase involved in cell wall biosynthesis